MERDKSYEYQLMEIVGEKLMIERERRLKSQKDIEEAAGLSYKHLSDLERGQSIPLATTYFKWCRALGVNGHAIMEEASKELEVEVDEESD